MQRRPVGASVRRCSSPRVSGSPYAFIIIKGSSRRRQRRPPRGRDGERTTGVSAGACQDLGFSIDVVAQAELATHGRVTSVGSRHRDSGGARRPNMVRGRSSCVILGRAWLRSSVDEKRQLGGHCHDPR